MRKIILLFSLAALVVLSGCASKETEKTEKSINPGKPSDSSAVKQEKVKTGASVSVDYIDFEATIVTEQNFDELNTEFDGRLSKSTLELSTQIVLTMNNHRDDLSAFNYKELSTLDGATAQGWKQFTERMGGHHVGGALTFPKNENPRVLVITGLTVGDAVLTF